jgi:hypothetical protein
LQEDELNTKVQLMRTSLKIWLHEERIHKTQWLRHQKPNQMNFFERIQNTHLIPPLFAMFIVVVFLLSLIA